MNTCNGIDNDGTFERLTTNRGFCMTWLLYELQGVSLNQYQHGEEAVNPWNGVLDGKGIESMKICRSE